jgi:MoaA/NifB/PqqE/SkfB family radical SAM enzyme
MEKLMPGHTIARDIVQKSKLYMGVLKAQRTQQMVPLVANLYLTGKCQARCSYCYVGLVGAPKKPDREFTLDEWKQLIDDLYDRGTRLFALLGGEPLLYRHIDEIIDYLDSKNVFINLSTNAFTLEKHIVSAKKCAKVAISIDGDQLSNDLNRGENNFKQLMEGIDVAVKNGVRVVLLSVVTKHTSDQVDWLIKFAEERKTYVTFCPLIDAPDFRAEELQDLRMSSEGVKNFYQELRKKKKDSFRIMNSVESIDYMINYPINYDDVIWGDSAHASYYPKSCTNGRFIFLFYSTGEVYPCGVMANNEQWFKAKNILDVGVDDALKHASSGLKCQSCTFANSVDWNSMSTLPWLWYGLKMTIKQALP